MTPVSEPSSRVRAAFVFEQTLGHVTHFRNLRDFAAQQSVVEPAWLPIQFEVTGAARLLPVLRSNWSVRASWRARRALDAALARSPLDALFFHTQTTSLFSISLMRRIPTVVSMDATPINYDSLGEHYGHRPANDGFLDRQKYQLNRAAFQAATRLVTWSDWARRSLIDDYGIEGDRVRVLAPGAATAFFEIGRARAADPERDNRGGRVKILFVGGDFRRKGGFALLDCLHGSLADSCELHVVTQSDVPPLPNVFVYRNLQANSLELQRLYADADLFALPTMADCLAIVLTEAMAAGLPVITTDVGPLAEVVKHGESGLVVPSGDTDALRAALAALAADAPRRTRMGQAGHALARQKFDSHRNNQLLLDLVVDLAQGRQATRRAA